MHFQGYLSIFRDIDAHSVTLSDPQLGIRGEGGRRETPPALYENRKKYPDLSINGLNFPFKVYPSILVPQTHPPDISHYLVIFRTLCNACISRNLLYSESSNIWDPSIIALQCIFKTLSYLRKQ